MQKQVWIKLLHETVDEPTHANGMEHLVQRQGFCFFATLFVNGEVLRRTCERAWVLLCNLTEVIMTRQLQWAWDINHNCWGLHKCDVFFPLARTDAQFLLSEGRNVDFSVLVSKSPDVFMFSIGYMSLRPISSEISQLIDELSKRKFIVNICWFQLLKCGDLLLFFVILPKCRW